MIGDHFRTTFGTHVVDLIRLDAKVREGNDPEALHEARVAVRRLRSYLRTFLPILDPVWGNTLRERLAWLNELFAEARDFDVLVAALDRWADAPPDGAALPEGLLERLHAERDQRHATVQAELRGEHYLTLLEEIVAAARHPQLNQRATEPLRESMRELLAAVWERARKPMRKYGRAPTDAELHEFRINTKHVRYAVECFEPIAGKPAKVLARHAARLQTVLGRRHDAVMAVAHLRGFPGAPPELFDASPARWRRIWRKMRTAYRRLRKADR